MWILKYICLFELQELAEKVLWVPALEGLASVTFDVVDYDYKVRKWNIFTQVHGSDTNLNQV